MSKYISTTETAKLVRAALKEAFPKTTFSVRSKSYSGGSSIRATWTDGPTQSQVKMICDRFAGASFDGMIDLKSYRESEFNGEKVHFGADYVFAERYHSQAFLLRCVSATAAYFNQPMPVMNKWEWFDFPRDIVTGRDTLEDLARQVINVTNADDGKIYGSVYIPTWIERVWEATKSPTTPTLTQVEQSESEPEDTTPCVKVSAETLEPIQKPDTLRERLNAINPDALSPIDALTLIYELKRLVS